MMISSPVTSGTKAIMKRVASIKRARDWDAAQEGDRVVDRVVLDADERRRRRRPATRTSTDTVMVRKRLARKGLARKGLARKRRNLPLVRANVKIRSPQAAAADGEAAGALYRLMAWLSPAYPVGAFSYSSG